MDLTVGLPLMFKVVTTGKGHIAHLHVEKSDQCNIGH